jgi:hypothetical protein
MTRNQAAVVTVAGPAFMRWWKEVVSHDAFSFFDCLFFLHHPWMSNGSNYAEGGQRLCKRSGCCADVAWHPRFCAYLPIITTIAVEHRAHPLPGILFPTYPST